MRHIKPKVNTLCVGLAASMGAVLLTAGTGQRMALPNARILSQHSGQPFERVLADSERDRWMSARDAQEYGLIAEVVTPRKR